MNVFHHEQKDSTTEFLDDAIIPVDIDVIDWLILPKLPTLLFFFRPWEQDAYLVAV